MNFKLMEDNILNYLKSDPNFCLLTGINQNLGDLPDPGKNKAISNQGRLKMLSNKFAQINKDELSFDEKINYELWELILEQKKIEYELEIDKVPQHYRMPMAAEMISGPLFVLFINDPREAKLRIVNIISRLDKVPDFLISYKRSIYEPVERWVKMELEKLTGLPEFFENLVNWAKETEFKNIARLEKAVLKANSALDQYANFLKVNNTSQNIFIGEKQMQRVIDSRGIKLSPGELHTIAKDFIAENTKDVDVLRTKLIQKYDLPKSTTAEELQRFLNSKYKVERTNDQTDGFDFVLDRYQAEREKILAFIKGRDLFPVMEDQDMHIMQTPNFMKPSIPAGAMMEPLAMRPGVKKSLVYLTLSEELLDEHTEISIPSMMIHEGIPGHHLQLSWSATNDSIVRRIYSGMDLAEGWTTMLEDYILDMGYAGELEDELRFSGKRDIARIGARVAIDLYFMSGDKKYLNIGIDINSGSDDPFVNAGNLLKAVTGFVDDRVSGELNWYSQERGYPLCYLTGNHLVWKLKASFKAQNPDQDDVWIDKEFHKRFLLAGNMPVSILEKIMLRS